MLHIPTAPGLHYVGDLAAWLVAFLGARWVYRRRRDSVEGLAGQTAPGYFMSLALGGAGGALWGFRFPTCFGDQRHGGRGHKLGCGPSGFGVA